MQNEKVGDSLNMVRVVLENHAARKSLLQFLDELCLEVAFEHLVLLTRKIRALCEEGYSTYLL